MISQNNQSNGLHFASNKNHPNHSGHVEINLSKMMEWSFLHLFKLGIFLLDLLVKSTMFFSSVSSTLGITP
jgi:hypothetical protein